MLLTMWIIFVIISVLLFLLIMECLFYQDSPTAKPKPNEHIGNWKPSIALITVNWLFIILATYGCYSIEWTYTSKYYSGNGTFMTELYSTESYYIFAYVFYVFFFIHVILFFYAGWMAWKESLTTEGEIEYRLRDKRWK